MKKLLALGVQLGLILLGVILALGVIEVTARISPGLILPGAVRNHFELELLKDAEKARRKAEYGTEEVYRQLGAERIYRLGYPGRVYASHGLDYSAQIEYNSVGLREPREPTALSPDQPTALFLGDSFVEGRQVAVTQTIPQLLEAQLAVQGQPWTVVNAGVDDSGTVNARHLLPHLGEIYQPEKVILLFYLGNDLRNNSVPFEAIHKGRVEDLRGFYGPLAEEFLYIETGRHLGSVLTPPQYQWLQAVLAAKERCGERKEAAWETVDGWFAEDSVAYRLLKVRFYGNETATCWLEMGQPALHQFIFDTNLLPELQAEAWHTTRYLLQEMKAEASNLHAEFLVVILPSQYGLNPDPLDNTRFTPADNSPPSQFQRAAPNLRLKQLLTELEITALDLTPALQQHPNFRTLFLPIDGHLNARGTQFVTEQIATTFHNN